MTRRECSFILRHMSNFALEQVAEMFKALSNPNRLSIFLRLISCCPPGTRYRDEDQGRRYVGELGKELNIVPSTVSHHVKELRRAGLIRVERHGKNIECWVDETALTALADLLGRRWLLDASGENARPSEDAATVG